MINLFYVPGMFGSTLEYVLSNYTHEHIPITAEICRDGSLHSYYKQAHVVDIESLAQLINNKKLYKIFLFTFNKVNKNVRNITNK